MLVVVLGVKFCYGGRASRDTLSAALTNHLLRALVAMITLTTAWAATRSGQITTNPETVIVPAGASSGSTLISWSTANCTAAQVTVTAAGGTEQLICDRTSFQNAQASWTGLKSFIFRLCGDRTRVGADEAAGPDGMSVAAQAGRWSTNTLSFEAVVRTNDPFWRIFGESTATLNVGSWSTNEISWHSSTNQSDVLLGAERRVFTVPTGTNTKKFLRINAQNP